MVSASQCPARVRSPAPDGRSATETRPSISLVVLPPRRPRKPRLALGAWQIMAPAIVLGACDLSVDEAVDTLVTDHPVPVLTGEPAGNLFGRPAMGETLQHRAAQLGLALQARADPASCLRLLVGITRLVTHRPATVALHLTRDARWRAIQSCRDLPDRAPVGLKPGNCTSLLQ